MGGGRDWVAVDLDGTLTDDPYDADKIGPLTWRGKMLLEMLKSEGYKILLYTGRIGEPLEETDKQRELIDKWMDKYGVRTLIDRIWPYPKPHFRAVIDDRAVRYRGDPEMSLIEVRHATDWVDKGGAAR
jgi:hypothetical protein